MNFKRNKFNVDLLWNVCSFGSIAIIGLLINSLIIKKAGTEYLGVFNVNYSIYLILSQLAIFGFHLSVQRNVPVLKDVKEKSNVLLSALFLSVLTSVPLIFLCYAFKEIPGSVMDMQGVVIGFVYCVPGLLFFSFNKIFLAFINGERKMKEFALFQLLRFVFLIIFVFMLIRLEFDKNGLIFSISLTEASLFLLLLGFNRKALGFFNIAYFKTHLNNNWQFGKRSFIGNFLFDANTKIDIMTIGYFLTGLEAGVYSFSSYIFEGFSLLPIVLRNNINPILSKLSDKSNRDLTQKVIKRFLRNFYKLLGALAIISVLVYPLVVYIFTDGLYTKEMIIVYSILIGGILPVIGYLPFIMIFNQFNLPKFQTLFVAINVILNIVLNIVFIQWFGLYGAALATSLAMTLSIFALKRMFKYRTKISL